jgi:hypothetical protein
MLLNMYGSFEPIVVTKSTRRHVQAIPATPLAPAKKHWAVPTLLAGLAAAQMALVPVGEGL